MKYALIAVLILWQAWTSIKLVEARHDIRHHEALMTETVKQCGEAWLEIPLKR